MSTLYHDLVEGFQEILESQNTGKKMKSTTISIPDVHRYTNTEIKRIRNRTGLTQTLFAGFMGVSKKTVEAWECGKNHPTGPACRLLALIETGGIKAIEA